MSPSASCDLPESTTGRGITFLFGLAPGGVYLATDVTIGAVRSYRTISPLPTYSSSREAVYFLLHFP